MKDGFIKVACVSPRITLGDPYAQVDTLSHAIHRAFEQYHANLFVAPASALVGVSAGDALLHSALLRASEAASQRLLEATSDIDTLIVFGAPVQHAQRLYNVAVVAQQGRILGLVPQGASALSSRVHGSLYTPAPVDLIYVSYAGQHHIPLASSLLFASETMPEFVLACEHASDTCSVARTAQTLASAGATVLVHLDNRPSVIGSFDATREQLSALSAQTHSASVLVNAGLGESSQDTVWQGECLVVEAGKELASQMALPDQLLVREIDVAALAYRRRCDEVYHAVATATQGSSHTTVTFAQELYTHSLMRTYSLRPWLQAGAYQGSSRELCSYMFELAVQGLMRRALHVGADALVLGLSGGLDSTLALLVAHRVCELVPDLALHAISMPGYGTTDRTHSNAQLLADALGNIHFQDIDITSAVAQHFRDIHHDPSVHNAVFENAQARERTQILMDMANAHNGLVVGTGDLSELALGWATFNGDHMSMYAVNASIPKTLVRDIVAQYADKAPDGVREILEDICATPISPELLPTTAAGELVQKTEDLVGPYELHDFFLYHLLYDGASPRKLKRLAKAAAQIASETCRQPRYTEAEIEKWLGVFCSRFFSQQFKRSCMPDGVAVFDRNLSPRGPLKLPSDFSGFVWKSSTN